MAQRQLDHFTDLSHLLAAATNIVVSNLVEIVLLLIALDGLALAVDDGVLGDNTVFRRVDVDHLEFDLPHAAADEEEVTLADRPVSLEEVGREKDIEKGAGEALDGVGDGQDGDSLGLCSVSHGSFDMGAGDARI